MVKFFVGLDLGQSSDYTALAVLERVAGTGGFFYHIRRLERVRGESYPNVAQKVATLLRSPALAGGAALIVDQTGVGVPVVDLLRQASLRPVAVSIHGGDNTAHDGDNWRVPKRDLVATLLVLLQSERLKVSSKLKLGPVLQAEMLNFKVKIDPATAHDSYSAWRESDHDDLVLSTALAAWWGEHAPKTQPRLAIVRGDPCLPAWRIGGGYGGWGPG